MDDVNTQVLRHHLARVMMELERRNATIARLIELARDIGPIAEEEFALMNHTNKQAIHRLLDELETEALKQ